MIPGMPRLRIDPRRGAESRAALDGDGNILALGSWLFALSHPLLPRSRPDRVAAVFVEQPGITLGDGSAVGAEFRRAREAAGEAGKFDRAFPAVPADGRHTEEIIVEDDVLQHDRVGIACFLHVLPLRRGGLAPPR